MANHSAVAAAAVAARSAADLSASRNQCDSVCAADGLPVADVVGQLSKLEHGLRNLLAMAKRWYMAENPRCFARESATGYRQKIDAYRSDHRQPVGAYRRRRQATRIRFGQEDHRTKAASCGGYARVDPGSGSSWSKLARSRRCLFMITYTIGSE